MIVLAMPTMGDAREGRCRPAGAAARAIHPRHGFRAVVLLACVATMPGPLSTSARAQAPAAAQRPAFRTGVDLVVVEASAVDGSGNVARGLRAEDFHAEIGGRAREVVSAELVEYGSPREGAAPVERDVVSNTAPTAHRTVLLVVDQTSLRFESRGVLEGAKRWLATLAPDDRVGFLGIPPPGPAVEFTTDRAKVLAAFGALGPGAGSHPPPYVNRNVGLWEALQIRERNDAVRAQVIARECRPRDVACPGQVDDNARAIAADSQTRVSPVLSALHAVLTGLRALQGPKHLVLVSSGWPMDERDATSRLASLAEDAALADATVHVVTAEEWAMSAAVSRVSATQALDRQITLSSVETLAGYTGGQAVRLTGNGEIGFKSLNPGLTGYYRVAVRPAPEDLDGRSKRIGLKVTRPGVSLVGYRHVLAGARPAAAPSGSDAATAARDAVRSSTPLRALNLKATSYVLQGEEKPDSIRVAVVGEVRGAVEGPAKAIAVLYGPDGQPAAGTETDIQIPASSPGHVVTMLTVAPGSYVLRLAVADRDGRAGTLDREVDATWHDAGDVETTGLVLLRSRGAEANAALEPLLDVLAPGERLIVQLPLSEPPGEGVEIAFELVRDDVGPGAALRFVAGVGRTTAGAYVAERTIPAVDLEPGRYTITASFEPGQGATFTRTFVVEATRP